MKKNLLLIAFAAVLPFVFAACSAEDDGAPAAPKLDTPTYTSSAVKLDMAASSASPYSSIEFTESGRAIIKKNAVVTAKKRVIKQDTENDEYIFATYTVADGVYVVTLNGTALFTLTIDNQTGSSRANVSIKMDGSDEEINVTAIVEAVQTAANDETTANLCRTWKVQSCRLRHQGSVTAAKRFDDGCNLNEILEYAKTKAKFDETLENDYVVKDVTFTTSGSFVITYENGRIDMGDWRWTDEKTGAIHYDWEGEDMGTNFESGDATFDVRAGKYTLTLKAIIDKNGKKVENRPINDDDYEIELSLYLVEA